MIFRLYPGLLVLACLLWPMLAPAAPQGWAPLLEPEELAAIMAREPEVRVIHVGSGFARGHVPGAVHAPFARWRGQPDNPGAPPPVAELEALARSLGIAADMPVAVVHAGTSPSDMGHAAWVYWMLRSLGVADLAILNGGFMAWRDAGLPIGREPATVESSDFVANWNDRWRVTTVEVEAMVAVGDARLIDARPERFYEGRSLSVGRPGTIRGARSLSYDRWFGDTRMVRPERARAIVGAIGAGEAPVTVSFCNTGHWAAIGWFALSELAGVENARLYPEGMAEWGQAARPLDNAPGRFSIYWGQARDWLGGLF
jgi:thiosulfate/3-mercaptopyruvate sulfurtransferase